MPDPVLGQDCDITLAHPAINAGRPVGFLVRRARDGTLVTLRRQAYLNSDGGAYTDRLRFEMTVLAADHLHNPDGSEHARTRAQIYADLLAFIAARSGITLVTHTGVWTGLYATLTLSSERLGQFSEAVALCLNNGAATQTLAIDPARFNNSLWDGVLTWASSYWR